MRIRRIDPLSCAKLLGALYAVLGLIGGAIFASIGMLGAAMGFGSRLGVMPGMFFGAGALILFPVLYGVLGFLGGLLMAGLYNLIAGWVGGIEITTE